MSYRVQITYIWAGFHVGKNGKPETSVQDWVSTFVSAKPWDVYFYEMSWHFHAVSVLTKTCILRQDITVKKICIYSCDVIMTSPPLFSLNTSAHLSTTLLHVSATICAKTPEITWVLSHPSVLVVTQCDKSPGPMDRLGFQARQRQQRGQSRRVQRWEAIWWLSGPDKSYNSWPASGPRGPLGSIHRSRASSWRAISEAPESESSCCNRRRDGWVDGWIQLVGSNRVEPGPEGMLLSMEEWKSHF